MSALEHYRARVTDWVPDWFWGRVKGAIRKKLIFLLKKLGDIKIMFIFAVGE